MAACTYHRQNGKRHALWHNNTPSLDFFANALAKNNVDCLVILWLENFAMVSIAAEKGMSRRSIFLFVEIRGLRPLIGLVSPGTERHGAVH
jgi:hypothetical protein